MSKKFLGRTLNEKTMTYSYGNDDTPLPMEMRCDVFAALSDYSCGGNGIALVTMWEWKERLGIKP